MNFTIWLNFMRRQPVRSKINCDMTPSFVRLNNGWNAEPNVPEESVRIEGQDLLLQFTMNADQFREFRPHDTGVLRFVNCSQYRLGKTNDEGWYHGQCRFSRCAPVWGEFYAITGDSNSAKGPDDWVRIQDSEVSNRTHFLFYFRERTFECIAEKCIIDKAANNALLVKSNSRHSIWPLPGNS